MLLFMIMKTDVRECHVYQILLEPGLKMNVWYWRGMWLSVEMKVFITEMKLAFIAVDKSVERWIQKC